MKYCLFPLLVFLLISNFVVAQITNIEGTVIDKDTKEPLPYATIQFLGTAIGTTTDIDGVFKLSTSDLNLNQIEINYLGYNVEQERIKPGKDNIVTIKLSEQANELETVVIKGKRRGNKDEKAVALFKRIVDNKDKNRPTNYNAYSYEEYTKTQFDVHNIKEKLVNRKILKPIDFVFENMDTTQTGVAFLPLLLKEKLSTVEYRKDINKTKTTVKADQFSGVDNDNLSGQVDYTFPAIDIYENVIDLGGKGFISPFATTGNLTYKYFITDSTTIDDRFCYKLEFTSRRKGDLAFTGTAYIDTLSAAVKSIDVYVLDQININFLSGLTIKQGYKLMQDGSWFKNQEQMEIIANLTESKKHQAIRITRSTFIYDILINPEIPQSNFEGDALVIEAGYNKRDKAFWEENRHIKLNETEENIYTYVDRIKATTFYKTANYVGRSLGSGFFNVGAIEIGRWLQFWSYNALEGNRYRLGFRTDPRKYRDKFSVEAYAAYGDKDKLFKYHLASKIHLKRVNQKWHMVGGHYRYDWSDYNFRNSYMTHDHTLNSLLRRSPLDNLFLIREANLFYEKEWVRGLTNTFSGTHKTVYQWPNSFQFTDFTETTDTLSNNSKTPAFQAVELTVKTRWGLDQVFKNFGGGFDREQVDINAPVMNFAYTVGLKGVLGGDYNYHKLSLDFSQKITTPLGRTYYTLGGEKIFGKIPYPLLKLHKGNRSFLYSGTTYNMMDDLEFVNDAYVKFDFRQQFDGFIFNAIPLIKRLKLRESFNFKAIYGTLSSTNQALLSENININDLNGFYAETGVGIENIGKLFQCHFIWRLTQREQPNVPKFAVKIYISPSF